jgi:RND family efflux transporter, MFP subunit
MPNMKAHKEMKLIPEQMQLPPSQRRGWLIAILVFVIATILCVVLWMTIGNRSANEPKQEAAKEETAEPANTVELKEHEADVKVVVATKKAPSDKLRVAGSVEANEQQVQQISSLAAGRVDSVNVALGDSVKKGMLLVRIESPQVAEMHGKLHEAETKLELSKAALRRVKQAANKVSILKAKATLDEAESTLKRTKQLVAEGLTARKDLVAAQSEFERAKAEYNFQKDITLNREVAEATANVQTSETEVEHIRDSLRALDAQLPSQEGNEHDISSLELRSPIAGVVIERLINPGAGVEAGKPLLTIANTSTLWVIANVPEKEMPRIQLGMPVQVFLEGKTLSGKVSYIDPRLNEDTRTSRVRIVIDNSRNQIQVGSFAQVEFSRRMENSSGAVFVPASSVQTIEGRQVVFVKSADGPFKVTPVRSGDEVDEMIPIYSGLTVGELVAADGSFVLKSKLLKDQLGDED